MRHLYGHEPFYRRYRLHFVFLGLIGGLLITGAAYYLNNNDRTDQEAVSQAAAKEVNEITDQIGKLMVLPPETPTLATITDMQPLQDQEFFTGAQVGDKVLIYPNSKQAILYRPSIQKVIRVAPIRQLDKSQVAGEEDVSPNEQIPEFNLP